MREIPVLFSTPMVQAILALIKRMTRRTKGLEKINENPDEWMFDGLHAGKYFQFMNKETGYHEILTCPYGKPGDILWVRETWCKNYSHEYGRYWYRADGEEIDMPTIYGGTVVYGKADGLKWRPSIHMPREACRIKLQVTNVRVERLQDITEEDVAKEGTRDGENYITPKGQDVAPWHIACFEMLWNSTLKEKQTGPLSPYRFCFNPWVWVISFERVEVHK